jgi:hypothetical protein
MRAGSPEQNEQRRASAQIESKHKQVTYTKHLAVSRSEDDVTYDPPSSVLLITG